MRVSLYFIGKPRDAHANAIAAEFLKRSGRYATCEMREISPERFDLFARHSSARKIFLDPAGRIAGEIDRSRIRFLFTMDSRPLGRDKKRAGAGGCGRI